jgi:hypothetical protein
VEEACVDWGKVVAALIVAAGSVIVAAMYITAGHPGISTPPGQTQGGSSVQQPAAGKPSSSDEVAHRFGGSPGEWVPYGPNGWVYRGSATLTFTVPAGTLVDAPDRRHSSGETVSANQLTIYWI